MTKTTAVTAAVWLLPVAIAAAVTIGPFQSEGDSEPTTASREEGASGERSHDPADAETAAEEAAAEAAPETEPLPAATELDDPDEAVVRLTVRTYVDGLNSRNGPVVCATFGPGAYDASQLPGGSSRGKDCPGSVASAIGSSPPGGGPAWRRTTILDLKAVALDDESARVTAMVEHRFSDRNYVSVEDDVIYLDRVGERWLLAKPSATFYRAVGYPTPPLRSFAPPKR